MSADPETIAAINALAAGLERSLDAKLESSRKEADISRARIHERIEATAKEARDQQSLNTAELRGSINTLGIQVTQLAERFGAHERADSKEVDRVDERIDAIEQREKDTASKTEGRVLTAAKLLFSGGAGAAIWEAVKKGGSE